MTVRRTPPAYQIGLLRFHHEASDGLERFRRVRSGAGRNSRRYAGRHGKLAGSASLAPIYWGAASCLASVITVDEGAEFARAVSEAGARYSSKGHRHDR
jgi:hypothetical protein